MESEGKKDCINISDTTKKLIEKNYKGFKFQFNKTIQYDNQNIDSWFISR